jgi:preprotein translocase subunit SecA
MIDRGVQRRVEQALATFDTQEEWDFDYVQQDLLVHYMLQVPEFTNDDRPKSLEDAQAAAVVAARAAFDTKQETLNAVSDESGQGFADRLLSLVMLNVLDEKWKDHLYDLDQLRASIHYRSWGQKDPLVEYKQDAYAMFVELMHDLANTFTERFLKAQLVFEPAPVQEMDFSSYGGSLPGDGDGNGSSGRPADGRPTKRYNALGILEDIPQEELYADVEMEGASMAAVEAEPVRTIARGTPQVVGAGSVRSLEAGGGALPAGWENTPRNNACPCGSGKKFKKCHGANL